jgi:hypothetical protein
LLATEPDIEVHGAGSAEEGFRLFDLLGPDILIVDGNLPDLPGTSWQSRSWRSIVTRASLC